jgi:non-ribosomal peptide synthetase component F
MHDATAQQGRPQRPPYALPPHLGAATRLPFGQEELEDTIAARFATVARLLPKHVAIAHDEQTLTYAELDQRSNRVAAAILAQRGPDMETVALLCDHTPFSIVAMLGAFKAGKRYVALEPALTPATLRLQFENAETKLLLTHPGLERLVPDISRGEVPVLRLDPEALPSAGRMPVTGRMPSAPTGDAAFLYTTGSTGRPKAAVYSHRRPLTVARRALKAYHVGAEDRMSHLFSFAAGGGFSDMYGALLCGVTLCLYDLRKQGVQGLASWLQAQRITMLHPPVAIFREFLATLGGSERFPDLRLIILGGEAVRHEDVSGFRRCFQPPCLLVNRLGSTELNVVAEYFIDHDLPIATETVPVGYATPGNQLLLVDDDGQILEIGPEGKAITGEIGVRSRALVANSWRMSDATAPRSLPDPDGADQPIFLNGDMGCLHADGLLEHLGRKDFMVKVRGYRVELAAIEAALRQVMGVKDAVVVAQDLADGDQRLVAYIVPAAEAPPTAPILRRALATSLPAYMAPEAFVTLAALPLSSLGKVDRKALPPPLSTRPALDVPYAAPSSNLESQLVAIWTAVLGIDQVGVHDPFLDVGGNSILAGRIAARISQALGSNFSLSEVLSHGTVAGQAAAIERLQTQAVSVEEVAELLIEIEALGAAAED